MKLTIITDEDGRLVGTIRESGQKAAAANGDPRAHVVVDPKHRTHEVEVPDELHRITDANKFHEKVSEYTPS